MISLKFLLVAAAINNFIKDLNPWNLMELSLILLIIVSRPLEDWLAEKVTLSNLFNKLSKKDKYLYEMNLTTKKRLYPWFFYLFYSQSYLFLSYAYYTF